MEPIEQPTPTVARPPANNSKPQIIVQPAASNSPLISANPVLIDGTLISVIVASFLGMFKMAGPGISNMLRSKQQAELEAQAETRKAELAADAKTQEAMHKLIEGYAKAEQTQSSQLTEAVINRVTVALDMITATQTKLVEQSEAIAKTQESIANTQHRTLEILLQVEHRLSADQRTRPRPNLKVPEVVPSQQDPA